MAVYFSWAYVVIAILCLLSFWFDNIKCSIENRDFFLPDLDDFDYPSYSKYFLIGMVVSGIGITIGYWGQIHWGYSLLMLAFFIFGNKITAIIMYFIGWMLHSVIGGLLYLVIWRFLILAPCKFFEEVFNDSKEAPARLKKWYMKFIEF